MQAHNNSQMEYLNMVLQLEKVCEQACKELKEEFNIIKKNTSWKTEKK